MKLPGKTTKPVKHAGLSDSDGNSFKALIRWTYQIHTYFVVGAESERDVLKQVRDLRNSEMCIAPKVSLTEDGSVESRSSSFSVVEICKDGQLMSPKKNTDLKA
jgi:acyl-CoA thioesterase